MPASVRRPKGLLLRIRVAREWQRAETMRMAIDHIVRASVDGSGEVAEALSMAASELLENAVKHGTGPFLSLRLAREEGAFVLSVTNRTGGAERTAELQRFVSWLQEHGDPLSAYCALVSTVAASEHDARAPGLGLARIVHAGGCQLSCDASVPGEITLRAIRRDPPRA